MRRRDDLLGRVALALRADLTVAGAARAEAGAAPRATAEATARWAAVDAMAAAPPSMGGRLAGRGRARGGRRAPHRHGPRCSGGSRAAAGAACHFVRGGPRSWLSRWQRAGTRAADRLEILDRRPVGAKESVCIVRAGREQFLIGVTASQISLLGRLGPAWRPPRRPCPCPSGAGRGGGAAGGRRRAHGDRLRPRPRGAEGGGPRRGALPAESTAIGSRRRVVPPAPGALARAPGRLGLNSVHAGGRRA